MPTVVTTLSHPYWSILGAEAHEARTGLGYSQAKVATRVGLSVRHYAALESGFIPPDVHDALGKISLAALDDVLGWATGASLGHVTTALRAAGTPQHSNRQIGDRSTYSPAAWTRLGAAVQKARLALRMSKPVLGYAMKSSSKTIMRLEEGRIYGDPRTAPPGDYNSERYVLTRLPLLEMALEWEAGQASQILDGSTASRAA
jgi:DNA-binding XRE family transcriptional regulator